MSKKSNRPDPDAVFPNPNLPRLCFIKNVVKNPHIIIGNYTYYDDVDDEMFVFRKVVLDK